MLRQLGFSYFVLLLILSVAIPKKADALLDNAVFPSDIPWTTRSSDHFKILYREGKDDWAVRSLQAAERAYRLLQPIFPDVPDSTWIVLADFQDATNGYALTWPYPHLVVFAAPPEASSELSALDDWLESVILHEYVHVLHMYPVRGGYSVLRAVFGSAVVPNAAFLPRHLLEGLAVFFETEMTEGGRGTSDRYAMYKRMAVEAGVWGTTDFAAMDLLDGSTTHWPHGESPYFFGYQIYKELWDRKGKEGIHDLVEDYAGNWPYFVNSPAKRVYGEDYPTIWSGIYEKVGEETKKEIERIKKEPLSRLNYFTESAFTKKSLALSVDGKKLAYKKHHPDTGPIIEIWNVDENSLDRQIEINSLSGDGLCWGKTDFGDKIIYIEPHTSGGYSNNYLNVYDYTEDETDLMGEESYRSVHRLACSPNLDRILIYVETAGVGNVKLLKPQWLEDNEVELEEIQNWQVPTGTWAASLLVGEKNWIALRERASTSLYVWENGQDPELVLQLGGLFWNLRPGRKSEELFVIGNFESRDEVWAINTKTILVQKMVGLLGGTNGFDKKDDKVYVSNYRHGGYDIASASLVKRPEKRFKLIYPQIPDEPSFQIWRRARDENTQISEVESYSSLNTLIPRFWVPNVFLVPDGAQLGAITGGFDVSQTHLYYLFGGYDTRGSVFGDLLYNYRFAGKSVLEFNTFYLPNYFTSSSIFFKRWGGSVGYGSSIGRLNYSISAKYRKSEATLIGSNLVPANQSTGLGLKLSYPWKLKRRPLSISPVRGTVVFGEHSQYLKALGSTEDYFVSSAGIDQYLETPWALEHVLYLGLRGGYTEGTSIFNHFFEGGGELSFQQGRGNFLNRGYLAGAFPARRIAGLNFEYRFPLLYIERGWGFFPTFLKVLHGAFTYDLTTFDVGILTSADSSLLLRNTGDLGKKFFHSVGFELKSDLLFSYYVPAQFRLGVYRGMGELRFSNRIIRGQDLRVTVGLTAQF